MSNSVKPIKVYYSTYWKRATFYNRIGNDYGEYTKCTQELRQMIFGRFICFAYLHTGPKLCEHNCKKKKKTNQIFSRCFIFVMPLLNQN